MPSTMNRRTALAGTDSGQDAVDPAVTAFNDWRAKFEAYLRTFDRPTVPDDDPAMLAAEAAEEEAARKLAATVPTSLAGVRAQLAFAHYAFGDLKPGKKEFALEAFTFVRWQDDDRQADLMRSLVAGLDRLAEEGA